MPNTLAYKTYGYLFALLLLLSGAAAAWYALPVLLVLPFVLLAAAWLVQNLPWLLLVLLIAVPWSVEFHFNPSLGTDLPDEPLMLLTAFATLAYGIVHRNALKKQWVHPLLLIVAVQLLWMGVSVAFSTYPLLSFKYLLAKGWYLLSFLVAPLLVFQNERWLRRSAVGIFLSMLVLVLLTLLRHAFNGFTFATINQSLEPFFRNHVNYSAVLVFIMPIGVTLYFFAPGKLHRYAFIAAFIVLLAAVYFSYARGAWLALLAGIAAYGLLRKKALLPAFLLGLALVWGALFWLQKENNYLKFAHNYDSTVFHTNFEEHLVATYRLQDVSTAERFYRWIAGVRMIGNRWQTGYGPNTFYNNYKAYGVPAFRTWVSDNEERSTVHNYFLLTFIEQGALGFLLLMIFVSAFFYYAQKLYFTLNDRFWKATIATTVVIFTMICTVNFLSDLIETDKVGSFYYLCTAVLIIADFKRKKQ